MVVVFFFTLIFSLWIVAGSKEEIDTPDVMTDCVPKVAVLRRVGELTDSFCSELCRAVSLVCRSKAMAETQQTQNRCGVLSGATTVSARLAVTG